MENTIAQLSKEKVDVEEKWEAAIESFAMDPETSRISNVPVQALALVVRQIMQPSFIWHLTPKLLQLLDNLELLRQEIVNHSCTVLESIQQKQSEGLKEALEGCLPSRHLHWLEAFANSKMNEVQRSQYCTISLNLRWHHLMHLLISRDRETFEAQITTYFPHNAFDPESIDGWSKQEVGQQALVYEQVLSIGEDEVMWHQNMDKVTSQAIYEMEFFKRFPPPTPFNNCLSTLEEWMSAIEDAHQ
ncbi:hypothetical protein FRB99_004260, partial [Tulasnella sp. 403]